VKSNSIDFYGLLLRLETI